MEYPDGRPVPTICELEFSGGKALHQQTPPPNVVSGNVTRGVDPQIYNVIDLAREVLVRVLKNQVIEIAPLTISRHCKVKIIRKLSHSYLKYSPGNRLG
jgi:hypothetical protein